METLEKLLMQHPFCQGLSPAAIELLAGCASQKVFNADEFLFREGEEAREFYLIRNGSVSVELFRARKGGLTVNTRGDGDTVGWLGLPPPFPWTFDARALTVTRTLALEVEALFRLCEAHHELGYKLLKRFILHMARYFRTMKLQLVDMYG